MVSPPAVGRSIDPIDRDIVYRPTPTPYDPRLMFTRSRDEPVFFTLVVTINTLQVGARVL